VWCKTNKLKTQCGGDWHAPLFSWITRMSASTGPRFSSEKRRVVWPVLFAGEFARAWHIDLCFILFAEKAINAGLASSPYQYPVCSVHPLLRNDTWCAFFSSAKKRVFAQMNKKKLLFFNSFVVPRTTLHLERGMVNFLRMKVKSSKEKAICCLGRCLLIYENWSFILGFLSFLCLPCADCSFFISKNRKGNSFWFFKRKNLGSSLAPTWE